jgi:stearoyl-CoA desaturase (delta-9 desaturase)
LIDGWAGVTWGFLLSTVILYHCTFFINSLNHLWGSRRFKTTDDSRNNFILAIVTLGEGWHNNHHHYQGSANQGFYWWEVDISYSALVVLSWFGIVWDLKRPKEKILNRDRIDQLTQEVTSVAGR